MFEQGGDGITTIAANDQVQFSNFISNVSFAASVDSMIYCSLQRARAQHASSMCFS